MVRGLYIAAEGMLARQTAQDVIASNLANANTNGFKADRLVFQTALERMVIRPSASIGSLSGGAVVSGTFADLSQGSIQTTGNPFDLALVGEGFFAIQTPNGVRYTRNGAFQLNEEGVLVTRRGEPVLGSRGPVQLSSTGSIRFEADGTVLVDGTPVDQLLIVTGRLNKEPSGLFVGNATPLENPTLVSGALESSNVSVVAEMIAMIEVMRAYEAAQRVIRAHDEALAQAVGELAQI